LSSNSPSPSQLQIIRAAMFLAALLTGLLLNFFRAGGSPVDMDARTLSALRLSAYALLPLAIFTMLALRAARSRQSRDQRGTVSVIGWAAAEAVAVFGAVFMFLGGEPWPWLGGLAVMFVSWQYFPVDPDRE
jgi:hypothetical protein